MPNTSKMIWPYPNKDSDPWFDAFTSMVLAMDASGYASREDRSIVLTGGGVVSFVASTGSLSWAAAIAMLSPIAGFKMTLPVGSVALQDGQALYVNVTRSPVGALTLSAQVGNQVPNTDAAMLLAIRSGTVVYWRNGAASVDGVPSTLFAGGGGGGGASPTLNEIVKLATRESHNDVTPLVVGGDAFNPNDYTSSGYAKVLSFRAVVANGDTGMTTHAILYNLTDGDPISTLSFTSTTPTKAQATLALGSGSGQIDLSEKFYEVRIALTATPGGPTNTIELYGAEILVVNTPT